LLTMPKPMILIHNLLNTGILIVGNCTMLGYPSSTINFSIFVHICYFSQGIHRVIEHHNLCMGTTLMDLFPNIGLDKSKLKGNIFLESHPLYCQVAQTHSLHLTTDSWSNVEIRRQFFVNYAKENDFDPQSPEHWHSHCSKIYFVEVLSPEIFLQAYLVFIFFLFHLFFSIILFS
jgi:hypothetical protein